MLAPFSGLLRAGEGLGMRRLGLRLVFSLENLVVSLVRCWFEHGVKDPRRVAAAIGAWRATRPAAAAVGGALAGRG